VLRAGVCNTDLEILKGYMGFHGVLGHEFVGIVQDVNIDSDDDAQDSMIGQRVCGDINVGCSECTVCCNAHNLDAACSKMSRNHCPNRTVLGILNHHGTMAEYLTLPIRNLHLVPKHVSDEDAVFAEPLAAACRLVEQKLIHYNQNEDDQQQQRPTDRVAILGDGKLGLMIAEVLGREHMARCSSARTTTASDTSSNILPPPPILFGKHRHKLDLVKDSGVDCKLVSECQDANAMNGVGSQHANQYDVVVDATGSPAGLQLASGLCRPMGTLCLKSTCAAGEQFNAAPFVIDELRVVGSRCGPIDEALKLLALTDTPDDDGHDGTTKIKPLHVSKYITKTFPLSQADEAIKCAEEKSTMKVQIICNEE